MRKQTDRSVADEPSSVEDIVAELVDSDKPVKSSGLADLSDLNSEEAKIVYRAWNTIEPQRRRLIIDRLVELAEDSVELNFDAIFKYCLNDTDKAVRCKAIEGLWENEESSFAQSLIDMMERDGSVGVKEEAAIALGRFAVLAEHGKLAAEPKDRIGQALLAAVDDESNPVGIRRRALEAVAPLNLPRVRQAIMEAYRSGDLKLKIGAVYAMGKNCDIGWLHILLEELASDSAELRYEAAVACGELGEEEAVPHLIRLTDDTDKEVQLIAVQALGRIGGSEAREHLELYLNHHSEAVRQVAEQALYELETMTEPTSTPWLGPRRRDD